MICLDCQAEPTKLCAFHLRTDNLVSIEDLQNLALEEIAIHASGLLESLRHAENLKHFTPCLSCQTAVRQLGEAIQRHQALR